MEPSEFKIERVDNGFVIEYKRRLTKAEQAVANKIRGRMAAFFMPTHAVKVVRECTRTQQDIIQHLNIWMDDQKEKEKELKGIEV